MTGLPSGIGTRRGRPASAQPCQPGGLRLGMIAPLAAFPRRQRGLGRKGRCRNRQPPQAAPLPARLLSPLAAAHPFPRRLGLAGPLRLPAPRPHPHPPDYLLL
jgi:hypothetical protein